MADEALRGSIAAFRLPDVLTFLSTSRKSGTLLLTAEGREARLFFNAGALVFASSNQEQFRLGQVLLRRKRITSAQRERIDGLMQRAGGKFGDLAVQQHLLTPEQLRDFLKVQVSEIVYDAFVWDCGSFAFLIGDDLPAHAVTIAVDISNLMMEGARRIAEWEKCLRLLPDRNVVFRVVAAPEDEKITLSAEEWKILFLINGQRTLEELCDESGDDSLQVYRVVYGLYANKLIQIAELPENDEETAVKELSADEEPGGDATVRQRSPRFGAESTVRDEPEDDTSLLISTEARLSYTEIVQPTVAQLTIINGEMEGTVLALTEPEYLIGRHGDSSIQLPDPGVSSFHARLYRGPEGYVIEDLKSRNGTWVNGSRVQRATLAHADRLHLGQTDITYDVLWSVTPG